MSTLFDLVGILEFCQMAHCDPCSALWCSSPRLLPSFLHTSTMNTHVCQLMLVLFELLRYSWMMFHL